MITISCAEPFGERNFIKRFSEGEYRTQAAYFIPTLLEGKLTEREKKFCVRSKKDFQIRQSRISPVVSFLSLHFLTLDRSKCGETEGARKAFQLPWKPLLIIPEEPSQ